MKRKYQVAATVVGQQIAWHCQTEEQLAALRPDHGKERKAKLTRWCRQVVVQQKVAQRLPMQDRGADRLRWTLL